MRSNPKLYGSRPPRGRAEDALRKQGWYDFTFVGSGNHPVNGPVWIYDAESTSSIGHRYFRINIGRFRRSDNLDVRSWQVEAPLGRKNPKLDPALIQEEGPAQHAMSYDYDTPHWLDKFEGKLDPSRKIVLSSAPIRGLRDTRHQLKSTLKPTGLWYACGDAWLGWLDSEMAEWKDDVTHIYELYTAPLSPWSTNGPVTLLRTVRDIDEFTEDYGVKDPWDRGGVDWAAVAKDFPGGIEICPYQWERRNTGNSLWYGGWDVASGCLWGPAGFRSVKLLGAKPGWSG